MNLYFHKVVSTLRSAASTCRSQGLGVGLRELRSKLWHRSCSLLYVGQGGGDVMMPESTRIVAITSGISQAFLTDILAAGAGTDIRFFDSGAICYLAYQNDKPVGLGWLFRDSYLLRKILPRIPSSPLEGEDRGEGIYLAGFHVIDSARGQGIYPLLLNVMSREAAAQGMASYVDVAPGNQASIRGIEKAGFQRVGELRTVAVVGMIICCKIKKDLTTDLH